jgi:hypothetical protein
MVAITVVVLAIGGMWIYAWFFAPKGNVDRFDDRAWADGAERQCAAVRAQVLALPAASSFRDVEPKEAALTQRAGVIDQATALLAGQLSALRQRQPADEKSRAGVEVWLADWDGYLESRRQQADRLRAGEDVEFSVVEVGGAPVTMRMDAFAKTNGMPSCVVPDDIG